MGKNSFRYYGNAINIVVLILFFNIKIFAQTFENKIFAPNIHTVLCANSGKEQSFPIIALGSNERLLVSFDDFNGGQKNYFYSIEHCTKDWQSSDLQTLYYVQSFNQDRINDIQYSQSTTQAYTHYSFSLPNSQVQPKISGNYILRVYLDNDTSKLMLTQRFYVVENKINVGVQMLASPDVNFRNQKQKINITLNTGSLQIQNAFTDLSVLLMQNMRPDRAIWNHEPRNISNQTISYDAVNTNDFFGGNEFRKFDIRSLRRMGIGVNHIEKEGDTLTMVQLNEDLIRSQSPYSQFYDDNGRFYVRINDRSNANNDIESDYADVFFTLRAEIPNDGGSVYVLGQFNNYQYTPQNKMFYDSESKSFYAKAKLKQGVYDYEYVYVNPSGVATQEIEGSYFDTSNEYEALVYYRRPSSRWDELLGFGNLNNNNSNGRNL